MKQTTMKRKARRRRREVKAQAALKARCKIVQKIAAVGNHNDQTIARERGPEILKMLGDKTPTTTIVFAAIRQLRSTKDSQ